MQYQHGRYAVAGEADLCNGGIYPGTEAAVAVPRAARKNSGD
ncbi:MAG: hypothetical protein WBP86_09415 [Thiobacillaceae bacterium]